MVKGSLLYVDFISRFLLSLYFFTFFMIQMPRKRKEIAFFDRRLLWLCIKCDKLLPSMPL